MIVESKQDDGGSVVERRAKIGSIRTIEFDGKFGVYIRAVDGRLAGSDVRLPFRLHPSGGLLRFKCTACLCQLSSFAST